MMFSNAIFVHPTHYKLMESEYLPVGVKLLPVFCSLIGIVICLILNKFFSFLLFKLKTSNLGQFLFVFLTKK